MSYNVDTWKTKEIYNLRIPIASFFKHERTDWHPERINNDDGTVTIKSLESEIKGTIEGDILLVSYIEASGEGSGTTLNLIFEPALKESTGTLVAVRVWEGGDSIDKLTVIDGWLISEEIEL